MASKNLLQISGRVELEETQLLDQQAITFVNDVAKQLGCENSCVTGSSCAFVAVLTDDTEKLVAEIADKKSPVCAVDISAEKTFNFTISKDLSESHLLISVPLQGGKTLRRFFYNGAFSKRSFIVNSLTSLQAPLIAAHLDHIKKEKEQVNKYNVITDLSNNLTLEKIQELLQTISTEVYSLSEQKFFTIPEMSADESWREFLVNENAYHLNRVRLNKDLPNSSESLATWKDIAEITEAAYEADPEKYCFDGMWEKYIVRGEKIRLEDSFYFRAPYVEYGESCGHAVKKIHTCENGSYTPDSKVFNRYQSVYCQVLKPDCSLHQHESCSFYENLKVTSHASGSYEVGGVMKLTGTCPNNHKVVIAYESDTFPRNHQISLGTVDCINGGFEIQITPTDTSPKRLIFSLINSSNQNLAPVYVPNIEIKKSTPTSGTDSLSNSYYIQDLPELDQSFDIPLMSSVLRQTVTDHFPENCSPYNLFSSYSSTSSSVWATIPPNTSLDFSGVVWSTSLAGTLITKRHFVYATHYAHPIGGSVTFTDRNGLAVQRTVMDRAVVYGDVSVALLNEEVPSTVKVYRVPHPKVRDFNGALTIVTNQDRQVWVANARFNYASYLLSDMVYFNASADPNSTYTGCFKAVRGGDSGNPDFFVMEDKLVLASTKHFAGHSGPYFGNRPLQEMLFNALKAINQKNNLDETTGFLLNSEKD